MLASVRLYQDKDYNTPYENMNHNFYDFWHVAISEKVYEWIKNNACPCIKGYWIIDNDNLIDFEDFYRRCYGAYPFEYNALYNSQALTFKVSEDYGIKVFGEE